MHLTDETTWALIRRLNHAHEHHGRFVDTEHARTAALEEMEELEYAHAYENPERVYEELLDVATVAIRYAEQLKREEVV